MFYKLKHRIKTFFYFSNRQTEGLFLITILILFLIITPQLLKLYFHFYTKPLNHTTALAFLEKNLMLLRAHAVESASIDINAATIEQLQEITGITPKLAGTIVHYRNKLGGFVSLAQYKEIYGLSKQLQIRLLEQTMITASYRPKQLSLNKATFSALLAHPYVSLALAKAIVYHRKQKGPFTNLSMLQSMVCSAKYKKLVPYFTL